MTNTRKTEDEWFTRHERDLIEELKRERKRRETQLAQTMQQQEAQKRRELHQMRCPKCGSKMEEVEASRVAFQCPVCGGNFVGRNELEDELLKLEEQRKTFRARVLRFLIPASSEVDTEAALAEVRKKRENYQQNLSELMKNEEAKKQKEVHWMNCPNCGSDLKEIEISSGIMVDECTVCHGIFLDAGEMQELLLQNESERIQVRRKLLELRVGEKK